MPQYFIIYKPYGVISQFSQEGEHITLASLGNFPKDVYPVGRLDTDSEGLLLLTNDKYLNQLLLHPSKAHERTYWVQVEGEITEEALQKLAKGVEISIDGKKHFTAPAKASLIENVTLPERNPPIRFRKNVPTSWVSLSLTEGKNRQVRRMTAAVGFPTLRLVRAQFAKLIIDGMKVGEVREVSLNDIL